MGAAERAVTVPAARAVSSAVCPACLSASAPVIAERIGWENSITVLRDRVRELRSVFLPGGVGVAHHV